jgi:imidazolonepropionase
MQKPVKIFEQIGELITLQSAAAKGGRKVQEADLSIVKDAAMVSVDGKIAWTGRRQDLQESKWGERPEFISLDKRTVMPAFVEPHTHLVFAGDRSEEFEWRMQGQTYQEISAKGGGILSTVKATRAASQDELLKLAQERAARFVRQGVATLEVKSGYGLGTESELKCLSVARHISGPRVIATYLGPHSRSPDHADLDSYMREIIETVLPRVAREKLADRVDIYIEKGFYTLEQGRAFFEAARNLGLAISAHVDQLSDFGGTDAALGFEPQSVDHVVYIKPETIAKLAASETTAVLLPTSDFYLKMRYPPARELIEAGARVALSTDFNPGTSPTQDLSLAGVLARIEMKMTQAEVISAFTLGGAWALGLAHETGSLEEGKSCDFIALEGSWRELFYSVGRHPVAATYRAGAKI